MRIIEVNTPPDNETINNLQTGDKVLITGTLYTARDRAHQLLTELIAANKPLPFDPLNSIIYYTGPVFSGDGKGVISAGPTTSSRMDEYTPALLEAGVKGLIGKGERSREVVEAIKKNRAVYFSAAGGAGVFLADKIMSYRVLAFAELGLEAVYEMKVELFPCYVAIDSGGSELFAAK